MSKSFSTLLLLLCLFRYCLSTARKCGRKTELPKRMSSSELSIIPIRDMFVKDVDLGLDIISRKLNPQPLAALTFAEYKYVGFSIEAKEFPEFAAQLLQMQSAIKLAVCCALPEQERLPEIKHLFQRELKAFINMPTSFQKIDVVRNLLVSLQFQAKGILTYYTSKLEDIQKSDTYFLEQIFSSFGNEVSGDDIGTALQYAMRFPITNAVIEKTFWTAFIESINNMLEEQEIDLMLLASEIFAMVEGRRNLLLGQFPNHILLSKQNMTNETLTALRHFLTTYIFTTLPTDICMYNFNFWFTKLEQKNPADAPSLKPLRAELDLIVDAMEMFKQMTPFLSEKSKKCFETGSLKFYQKQWRYNELIKATAEYFLNHLHSSVTCKLKSIFAKFAQACKQPNFSIESFFDQQNCEGILGNLVTSKVDGYKTNVAHLCKPFFVKKNGITETSSPKCIRNDSKKSSISNLHSPVLIKKNGTAKMPETKFSKDGSEKSDYSSINFTKLDDSNNDDVKKFTRNTDNVAKSLKAVADVVQVEDDVKRVSPEVLDKSTVDLKPSHQEFSKNQPKEQLEIQNLTTDFTKPNVEVDTSIFLDLEESSVCKNEGNHESKNDSERKSTIEKKNDHESDHESDLEKELDWRIEYESAPIHYSNFPKEKLTNIQTLAIMQPPLPLAWDRQAIYVKNKTENMCKYAASGKFTFINPHNQPEFTISSTHMNNLCLIFFGNDKFKKIISWANFELLMNALGSTMAKKSGSVRVFTWRNGPNIRLDVLDPVHKYGIRDTIAFLENVLGIHPYYFTSITSISSTQ